MGSPTGGASFGSELRRLRLLAGLSQEMLAERAGLSTASIAAYERNRRRRPYANTLASLATALELAPAERAAFMTEARESVPGLEASHSANAPAENSSPPTWPRLPRPPTALFGRELDIRAAASQLDPTRSSVRMLSLIGPGGVGKTRLALAVADELVDAYPDGIVLVDLASIRDYRLVPAAIAQALHIDETAGRSARELVLHSLRDRRLLLVLDNLEQLLGAASLLAEVVASCPKIALLVTSRVPLRIRAEHRFMVSPLALPSHEASFESIAAAPSVRMFVDRAQVSAPGFELDDTCAPTVAAVCRRLDGNPLAIELAAARLALLGPATLLERLNNALALLEHGPVDAPQRQQTLRQTLDWSHDLLGPPEQILLRRLAVFSGGFTLSAAEIVCQGGALTPGDVLEALAMLADSSLIVPPAPGSEREPRFAMLQTVHDFAHERLTSSGEAAQVARQHLRWALSQVQPVSAEPPDPRTLTWLSDEADNIRAALRTAIDVGAVEDGLWLAVAISTLWFVRGAYREARDWLSELLALPGAEAVPGARAHGLTAAGHFAYLQTDCAAADGLLAEAESLAVDLDLVRLVGVVRHFQGNVARARGDLEDARVAFASALDTYRRVGHRMWEATALAHLGFVLYEQGDLHQAAVCAEESLELFQEAGNTWGTSRAVRLLGRVAAQQREAARALSLHEKSVALGRDLADNHDQMHSALAIADDVHSTVDAPLAWRTYHESLLLAERSGNPLLLVRSLEGLARLSAQTSPSHAVHFAAAADALRSRLGVQAQEVEQQRVNASMEVALRMLGAATFAAEWTAGRRMDIAQLVAAAQQASP